MLLKTKSTSSLDYVVLRCRDLAAARKLYGDALGLPVASESADGVQFQVGSMVLALRPLGDDDSEGPRLQLGFRVDYDQVPVFYERLRDHGVKVLEPPRDQGWGHRTLFLADPDRNLLEIFADLPGEHGNRKE